MDYTNIIISNQKKEMDRACMQNAPRIHLKDSNCENKANRREAEQKRHG